MFQWNKLTLLRTLATLGPQSVRSKGTWRVFTKCTRIKDLSDANMPQLGNIEFSWKLCYSFIFRITSGTRSLYIITKAVVHQECSPRETFCKRSKNYISFSFKSANGNINHYCYITAWHSQKRQITYRSKVPCVEWT